MHVPDGILPAQVSVAGYAIAGGVTWVVLRRINKTSDPQEEVPRAALLSAAFFVGSSIHLPVPPASVHLVLNGLLGTVLGWYAWPAILIGLLLQAILLGHGGLTTLGVNATLIGLPALVAAQCFRFRRRLGKAAQRRWSLGLFSFLAGAIGVGLSAFIFFSLIVFTTPSTLDQATEQGFLTALMIAHIPLILLEGLFTMLLSFFLLRVKPELLKN
ncbi:cobalt transporter CbiM [Oscillatoria sp. CS-180]|uniref:cobalt transporter CbiM n=1 Tax=Oscillatoria sp. CS-180 TaxID=3021720 RepID=UPI00233012D5|nr:cobalt transporter CbiM [Oscillatoria sp. CS-180]MDB9525509.1 cobalt transporter CbiM [Oscillatoria sp. CS-180]